VVRLRVSAAGEVLDVGRFCGVDRLQITCHRRSKKPSAVTAKTPKNGLEITAGTRAPQATSAVTLCDQVACDPRRAVPNRPQIIQPLDVQIARAVTRGWAAYFRFGNSADRFGKISEYARMRMALFVAKRTRRTRKFGWAVLACRSPDQLGLITLSGIVVAPYPFKDWRVKPNAAGERRR
jgi:Group II intron, maturase-specific domain